MCTGTSERGQVTLSFQAKGSQLLRYLSQLPTRQDLTQGQ